MSNKQERKSTAMNLSIKEQLARSKNIWKRTFPKNCCKSLQESNNTKQASSNKS